MKMFHPNYLLRLLELITFTHPHVWKTVLAYRPHYFNSSVVHRILVMICVSKETQLVIRSHALKYSLHDV
jgi:hypothetical protein